MYRISAYKSQLWSLDWKEGMMMVAAKQKTTEEDHFKTIICFLFQPKQKSISNKMGDFPAVFVVTKFGILSQN